MGDDINCPNCNRSFPLSFYIYKHVLLCKTAKNLMVSRLHGNRPIMNLASNKADSDSDMNYSFDSEDGEEHPIVRPLFDDYVLEDAFNEDVYCNKRIALYAVTYGENSIYAQSLEDF